MAVLPARLVRFGPWETEDVAARLDRDLADDELGEVPPSAADGRPGGQHRLVPHSAERRLRQAVEDALHGERVTQVRGVRPAAKFDVGGPGGGPEPLNDGPV